MLCADSQIGLDRKKTDERTRKDSGNRASSDDPLSPSAQFGNQLASNWNVSSESLAACSTSAHTSPATASDSASVREWKERYASSSSAYEGWTVFESADDLKSPLPPAPTMTLAHYSPGAASSSWMPVWSTTYRRVSSSPVVEGDENCQQLSRQCDPRTMQDSSADLSRYMRVLNVERSNDPQFDIRVSSEARCGPIVCEICIYNTLYHA